MRDTVWKQITRVRSYSISSSSWLLIATSAPGQRWFRPAKFGYKTVSTSFRPQGVDKRHCCRNWSRPQSGVKRNWMSQQRLSPARAKTGPLKVLSPVAVRASGAKTDVPQQPRWGPNAVQPRNSSADAMNRHGIASARHRDGKN